MAWVKTEPAILFSSGVEFGSRKILPALEATLGDVNSCLRFLAITHPPHGVDYTTRIVGVKVHNKGGLVYLLVIKI